MTIRRAGRRGGAGGRDAANRRRILVAPAASLAACSVLLAACGGGGLTSTSTTDRPMSSTSTSVATSISTADPGTAAVLAAYRAAWAAFEHAATDANPEDPELAATMVDPQLQGVKANLLADQRQGIVGRGTFTFHPKIVALSATEATVVDCAYSTAVLVYAATGKPVPPVTPPENDGVRSALVLTGGTWKVYKQTVTDGSCAPGS
jgi:hypothetical protein